MGGLSFVTGASHLTLPTVLILSAALAGCDQKDVRAEEGATVTKSRSQAIEASGPAAVATLSPAKSAPSAKSVTRPARKLCEGQLGRDAKPLPKKPIFTRAASGVAEPLAEVPHGAGKWTWLNFWAAWCVPCKEEIPRLLAWETRLSSKLRVAFVSLDDDQRQLAQFLDTQPAAGLRATLWLREGKEREDWLAAASQDKDPELPLHLLIDPKGKIVCAVQGAVEDADFESLQSLLAN